MEAPTVGARPESGGNRNGGLKRYSGNRTDMKWRSILIWASKEREMMASRQLDPQHRFLMNTHRQTYRQTDNKGMGEREEEKREQA